MVYRLKNEVNSSQDSLISGEEYANPHFRKTVQQLDACWCYLVLFHSTFLDPAHTGNLPKALRFFSLFCIVITSKFGSFNTDIIRGTIITVTSGAEPSRTFWSASSRVQGLGRWAVRRGGLAKGDGQ